jgi:hypothetical protein
MKIVSIIAAVLAAGVAVAAAGLFVRRWPGRGTDPDNGQLAAVVADAFSAEWAALIVTDPEVVRDAMLYGEPAAVSQELSALVADVEVTFELIGPGAVPVAVACEYADSSLTTVRLEIPWEQVPDGERAKFLRKGCRSLSRHWTWVTPGSVPGGPARKSRLNVF